MREEKSPKETLEGAFVQVARHLQRVMKMGAWLTMQPSIVNGMELGAQ